MKKAMSILLTTVLMFSLTACGETASEADKPEQTEQVVYQDDILTATYKGVSDVAGQIGIGFTLTNNSDDEISVIPLDSSVNDVMVQFTSGTLAIIQPGKTFNQVWLCNPSTIGITNSDEVENIEFSLSFGDVETDTIQIQK